MMRTMMGIVGLGMAASSFSLLMGAVPARDLLRPAASYSHAGAARGRAARRLSTFPAGTRTYVLNDPSCPGNPDSFETYVEWWNDDDSFAYDIDVGHSSYYCGSNYVGENISSNSDFIYCENNSPSPYNCQSLGFVNSEHP